MLSLCCAQRSSYLQRIIFPSLGTLQHYTEFDVRTIAMLEKLLNLRSFSIIVGNLAYPQLTPHASSEGLGLPSVVQHVALIFFKCWVLITFALVFHFQYDHHPILLDLMAHVKANIYHFQVALQDTHVTLYKVVQSHGLPFESLVVQSYLQMQFFCMD
jgi:hypothetical protein